MSNTPPRRVLAPVLILLALAAVAASAFEVRARRVEAAIVRADPETILGNPALARPALALGRKGFEAHCASCHGTGKGDPARGVPDLTDHDFLYGSGLVGEIEQIVLHGIRSGDPAGWNLASMPVYASARPYAAEPIPPMTPQQVRDVTEFILLNHRRATDPAAAARGARLYAGSGGCYDCHGNYGEGNAAIGAPNLLDDVWLYGDGSTASIERTIAHGRAGFSPAFARTLSPLEARAIAVYVASLPGNAGARPRG